MLPSSPRHIEAVYEVGLSEAAAFVVVVCGDIMAMRFAPSDGVDELTCALDRQQR
jgi:hypothetical protein